MSSQPEDRKRKATEDTGRDTNEISGGHSFDNSERRCFAERTQNDILCGRGKCFQNHYGNLRMHEIISAYRERYLRSSRLEKHDLVIDILKRIKREGARFVKPSKIGDSWVQVDDKCAFEKVSHALRCRRQQAAQAAMLAQRPGLGAGGSGGNPRIVVPPVSLSSQSTQLLPRNKATTAITSSQHLPLTSPSTITMRERPGPLLGLNMFSSLNETNHIVTENILRLQQLTSLCLPPSYIHSRTAPGSGIDLISRFSETYPLAAEANMRIYQLAPLGIPPSNTHTRAVPSVGLELISRFSETYSLLIEDSLRLQQLAALGMPLKNFLTNAGLDSAPNRVNRFSGVGQLPQHLAVLNTNIGSNTPFIANQNPPSTITFDRCSRHC